FFLPVLSPNIVLASSMWNGVEKISSLNQSRNRLPPKRCLDRLRPKTSNREMCPRQYRNRNSSIATYREVMQQGAEVDSSDRQPRGNPKRDTGSYDSFRSIPCSRCKIFCIILPLSVGHQRCSDSSEDTGPQKDILKSDSSTFPPTSRCLRNQRSREWSRRLH